MKELALLMFFIGLGYTVRQIQLFFSHTHRRLYFAIPSSSSFNILWGFMFYMVFASLMAQTSWIKIALIVIETCLLFTILILSLIRRQMLNHPNKIFAPIFIRLLAWQQREDSRSPDKTYNRDEALRILGLPANTSSDNPHIAKNFAQLEQLQNIIAIPYLREILNQIQKILSLK